MSTPNLGSGDVTEQDSLDQNKDLVRECMSNTLHTASAQ